MDSQREIARQAKCPPLTPEEIEDITHTVFIPSNPQKSDVLFVFGTRYSKKWPEVADLYKKGFAPYVYICGGILDTDQSPARIISHVMFEDFMSLGVPEKALILDENSTNTLEDAVFGKKLFEENNIPYKKILFAAKGPHSGRCLRTLKKVFPDSELFPFVYDYLYKGNNVTPEKWTESEFGRSHVWGEYQRIKKYSERGDICP